MGPHSPRPHLLELGAPRQLLHSQGKALGEPQLTSTTASPEQHPPICGRTQDLETVAVPGFRQPEHLRSRIQGSIPNISLTPSPPSCSL